ncbi:MAG: cytochrome c biogenesis protein CcsA [Magnetococcales bacterium]|nr:cytochrome c biogenesis protein CcsA [Magnetococcales bacterium]NGZ26307.1 cytochrome c biogenesis protein CcsA [Magnetococcales bacterium]
MDKLAKIQRPLGLLTLVTLAAGLYMVFTAPVDFQQGNSVRILYAHVPSAKLALGMYLVLTIASALYLWKRTETLDIIAEAAAPVGALFALVTLASGSIWGKPMWGAWWAWDARLTSVLVLLIIYVGIIALRHSIEDPRKSSQASAVLALVGFVDLPIIHFSVVWWRTLHQPASMSGPGKIAIVGPLLPPLLVMSAAFLLMGAYLLVVKSREVAARRQLEALDMGSSHHD